MAKNTAATPSAQEYFTPEMDARTLVDAHKVKSNPKRHAAAKSHLKTQAAAMRAAMMSDPEDNPKMGGDGGKDEAMEKA